MVTIGSLAGNQNSPNAPQAFSTVPRTGPFKA